MGETWSAETMTLTSNDYRRIAGHFATGVTVITTSHDGLFHGMTANAFMSVSLEPLLALVSIDKVAHAHEQVDRAGRFCVNLLSEAQEELSTLFAKTAPPEEGQLRGAAFHSSPGGMLVLDGCIAYIECGVRERYGGGDHTLFLAEVLDGSVELEAAPLIFYQARYRKLERPVG
jgi:flavin reductase (DIM6/NTAB) family NADH-FMN oxidoreductase RutF